ncbi:MAG: HAMP domain-containing sensor histidine kinase [Beijerinckiaceae bacterium]
MLAPSQVANTASPARRGRLGLSGKLLLLTILFVMLAAVLIYVPTVANYHRTALNDRLAAAQVAALVIDAAPDGMVPRELEVKLLDQIGAVAVAIKTGERRRLLAATDASPPPAREIDLRTPSWWSSIRDAFGTLVGPQMQMIRAVGSGMDSMDFVEIVLPERPIRVELRQFSLNVLSVTLFISVLTGLLVYLTLHLLIVRPVRRLSDNVSSFAGDPEDARRIITPTGRSDEIGAVETAVADMEKTLAREFREKKHLAALGLAVSKINHDLRNMLASAQLISDRLSQVPDPVTQRFAPKLVSALDRAIAFCQSTLAYGKISEQEPQRERVQLAELVRDIAESLGLDADHPVKLVERIPPAFAISADREHIYRTLLNLMRNAVQALSASERSGGAITIIGWRSSGGAIIDVIDDGPGIDSALQPRLFQAFTATGRPGGVGLGLAIAAELIQLNGGTIVLRETEEGAAFRITLPEG